MERGDFLVENPIRIGLIGFGRWGQNYFNTLNQMPGVQIVGIAGRPKQIESLRKSNNEVCKEDWRDVCENPLLDGIIVATPPNTHFEITKFALERGLPVLVEKPFTTSLPQTIELRNLAEKKKTLCMVGYTHIFSKGYRDLRENIAKGGKIKAVFSEAYGFGPFRKNCPVLWDWGSHDLAMCIDLLGHSPKSVSKSTVIDDPIYDHAQIITLQLGFDDNVKARCTFGNAAQFKRRDFCVVCDAGVFVYDGLSSGLAKQYSKSVFCENKNRFEAQPSPLMCTIGEFANSISRGLSMHRSLELSTMVNSTLSLIPNGE